MGATKNSDKQKWNASHYTQVKVSVPNELAAAFKDKCLSEGVSMAGEIARFMREKINVGDVKKPSKEPYSTRPMRRKELVSLTRKLADILEAEQQYMDNIPDNLQSSRFYEAAEQSVQALEDTLERLNEAY
jgi:hypothetical protein